MAQPQDPDLYIAIPYNAILCSLCGALIEYEGGVGIVVELACPLCDPGAYDPPSEECPWWIHRYEHVAIVRYKGIRGDAFHSLLQQTQRPIGVAS